MKKSLIAAAFAATLPNLSSAEYAPAPVLNSHDLCIDINATEQFCSSASREPYYDRNGQQRENEDGAALYILPEGYVSTPEGRKEDCVLLIDENYEAQEQPFCKPDLEDMLKL